MKSVVMWSGGLDSTVLVAHLMNKKVKINPLILDNNSRYFRKKMIFVLKWLSKELGFEPTYLTTVDPTHLEMDTKSLGGVVDYVPGFQTFMVFPALAYADKIGVDIVYSGITREDSLGHGTAELFPGRLVDDDSPLAMKRMQKLYSELYGVDIDIQMPFENKTKTEIINTGLELGVPLSRTCSCTEVTDTWLGTYHCGKCWKCRMRIDAFKKSGVENPEQYTW